MLVSTQHLLPPPEPIVATSVPPATIPELPSFSVAPQPAAVDQAPPSESTFDGAMTPNPKTEDSADMNVDVETVDQDSEMKPVVPVQDAIKVDDPPEIPTATATEQPPEPAAAPVESQPAIPKSSTYDPTCSFPGGFPIDVEFEASKLPLDVAVFNSARACGGDEKIRKYLQAVLVVGGTSLIPGMAHALESR
jgi:actin-related protein 8